MKTKFMTLYRQWLLTQLEKVERSLNMKSKEPVQTVRYKRGWACSECNSMLPSVGFSDVCQCCGIPVKFKTSVPDNIFISREEIVENYREAVFVKEVDSLDWVFKGFVGAHADDVMDSFLKSASKEIPDFDWGATRRRVKEETNERRVKHN